MTAAAAVLVLAARRISAAVAVVRGVGVVEWRFPSRRGCCEHRAFCPNPPVADRRVRGHRWYGACAADLHLAVWRLP